MKRARALICPERLNEVAIARYVLVSVEPITGSALFEPVADEVKRGSPLVRAECRDQIIIRGQILIAVEPITGSALFEPIADEMLRARVSFGPNAVIRSSYVARY